MTTQSEETLAGYVVDYFDAANCVTYKEVRGQDGNTADIVVTKSSECVVVEAKLARSLVVILQAKRWIPEANMVFVAVPRPRRGGCAEFVSKCESLGIGILYVDQNGAVEEILTPHRRPCEGGIRLVLREEHRTFANAGNAKGKRWSKPAEIAEALQRAVAARPGVTVREFVESIDHHYGSDDIATVSLSLTLKRGGIKGLEIRHGGKVVPEGFNRHTMRQTEGTR